MRTVKLAVGRNHFRLVPDAEFQSHSVNAVNKPSEVELFLVNKPVAETVGVIISLAEPAVIHNEHFNTEFLCTLGK